jgi:hypothetical protein
MFSSFLETGRRQIVASVSVQFSGGSSHSPTAPAMFPDIAFDSRVSASELGLIPQPDKNALCRVTSLARTAEITLLPLVGEASEAIEFGPRDLSSSLLPWRNRKAHHLLHARARYPRIHRSRPLARAAPTPKANLQT